MNNAEFTYEEVKEALDNGVTTHLKNQIIILPEWSDFIKSIDTAISEPPKNQRVNEGFEQIGNVLFFDKLAIGIDHSQTYNYPGLKEMKEYIEKFNLEVVKSYSFINFSSFQKTVGEHKDDVAAVYVQIINSVKWVIYTSDDVNNRESTEFILNPGDVIFKPKGVYHEVIPFMPRVGMSFVCR